jgi:hypothetical protein
MVPNFAKPLTLRRSQRGIDDGPALNPDMDDSLTCVLEITLPRIHASGLHKA